MLRSFIGEWFEQKPGRILIPLRPGRPDVEQVWSRHEEEQDRRLTRLLGDGFDEVEKGGLGPLNVVEDRNEGPSIRELFEEPSDRPESALVPGDCLGDTDRLRHALDDQIGVRRRLDQRAVDRGEAERQRDERQGHEEDRVADDGGPGLAVKAGRRPEGEQAERGDDRRQREGRDPQKLEDVRPWRDAPPQEPGKRQRDGDGDGRRADGEQDRRDQCPPPLGIGENLSVPGPREADRRKSQILILVDRYAGHHDQRQGKKQADGEEIDAAQESFVHSAFSLRPARRVRPTSASEMSTRNTAMAAAKGMFDW